MESSCATTMSASIRARGLCPTVHACRAPVLRGESRFAAVCVAAFVSMPSLAAGVLVAACGTKGVPSPSPLPSSLMCTLCVAASSVNVGDIFTLHGCAAAGTAGRGVATSLATARCFAALAAAVQRNVVAA